MNVRRSTPLLTSGGANDVPHAPGVYLSGVGRLVGCVCVRARAKTGWKNMEIGEMREFSTQRCEKNALRAQSAPELARVGAGGACKSCACIVRVRAGFLGVC